MTEVRIRRSDEAESRSIGDVDLTASAIAAVIPLLNSWGVLSDGNIESDLVGQFVVDDREAYFEVVIEVDET